MSGIPPFGSAPTPPATLTKPGKISIQQIIDLIASEGGGAGGLTASSHEALRQLVHLAEGSGPFEGFATGAVRVIAGGPFPSSITWYTDNTLTSKIVEKLITYNPNKTPATIYWAVYGVDGTTVLATAMDTISYSGAFEVTRVRVFAP